MFVIFFQIKHFTITDIVLQVSSKCRRQQLLIISPVATGGLLPPSKALRPPKLERETLLSGVWVNFIV